MFANTEDIAWRRVTYYIKEEEGEGQIESDKLVGIELLGERGMWLHCKRTKKREHRIATMPK